VTGSSLRLARLFVGGALASPCWLVLRRCRGSSVVAPPRGPRRLRSAPSAEAAAAKSALRGPLVPAGPGRSTPVALGASLVLLAAAAGLSRRIARRAGASEVAGEAVSETKENATQASIQDSGAAEVARTARAAAAARRKPSEVFDVAAQAGVTAPLGYWDPLGLCPPDDRKAFRKLRTAELKHGRIAMLASIGLVAQHFIRLPSGVFDDVPNGLYAPFTPWGGCGCLAIVWVCLVLEFVFFAQDPMKEVGDFGDPLNVNMYDAEMRDRELNNGRFAMIATMGILIAELATGKDAVEQLSF